jgi:hypothetical protein
MLRETADIDETAARQMRPLDQPRANQREGSPGAKDRNDNDDCGHWLDCLKRLRENRDG